MTIKQNTSSIERMQRCEMSPGQGPVEVSKIFPSEPGPYLAICAWISARRTIYWSENKVSVNVNLQLEANSGPDKRHEAHQGFDRWQL